MKLFLALLTHVFIHALVSQIFTDYLLLCKALGIRVFWKVGSQKVMSENGQMDEARPQQNIVSHTKFILRVAGVIQGL